jgi:hypothetical protein
MESDRAMHETQKGIMDARILSDAVIGGTFLISEDHVEISSTFRVLEKGSMG